MIENYLIAAPCTAFFVILDGFLELKQGQQHSARIQRRLSYVSIGALLFFYAFSLAKLMIALSINVPLLLKIVNFTQQIIIVALSISNIIVAIVFVKKFIATKIANVVRQKY